MENLTENSGRSAEQMKMGFIDIHAHILPGVDDGSRNMEETLGLLRLADIQGIKKVVATPHLILGKVEKEAQELLRLTAEVQKEAAKIVPELQIYPGQEIYYFDSLTEYLDQGKALTLAGSRYVLIEFSPAVSFRRMEQAVRTLILSGYRPVLAHVERYACMKKQEAVNEIVRAGGLLQMNFTSIERHLSGRKAWVETSWCRRMLLEGRIHFMGTDMHRIDYRPPEIEKALAWLNKKLGEDYLSGLLQENPAKLLEAGTERKDGQQKQQNTKKG